MRRAVPNVRRRVSWCHHRGARWSSTRTPGPGGARARAEAACPAGHPGPARARAYLPEHRVELARDAEPLSFAVIVPEWTAHAAWRALAAAMRSRYRARRWAAQHAGVAPSTGRSRLLPTRSLRCAQSSRSCARHVVGRHRVPSALLRAPPRSHICSRVELGTRLTRSPRDRVCSACYAKSPITMRCQPAFRLRNPDQARPLVLSCLLYTSPSPRDATLSRMPSSA